MEERAFRLVGKDYRLTKEELEERLSHVSPKPIGKYFVTVNGRPYPPKQVLSVALDIPLVSFTTMDANRILHGLRFEVQKSKSTGEVSKTESERLFEDYLNASGLTEFRFEEEFEQSSRKPDYTLFFRGDEILLEVKEFHATEDDLKPGGGFYDPYRPLREKFDAARKKFQEFDGFCCCLLLYNHEKPLVHLEWRFIYGAMLGNLGFQIPIDIHKGGQVGELRSVFGSGGKMHRHDKEGKPFQVQNTTLSAILVLEQFRIGYCRFQNETSHKEREMGRQMTFEEYWEMINRARGTERDISLTQVRVVVHENPYANVPLPEEIFRGPYDERYGPSNGHIRRIFAGEEILKLEGNQFP